MAARHDNSVIERKLRPVYDWLEQGNNRKALQECEKVIKKWPNVMGARALRCLAWLRLGREAEACSHLESLIAETPTEDATLQVITMCYKELQQLDKVCALYERAVKIDSTNEELLTHLFMSYVRIGAFDKQRHAAMQLYKLKPKNPYYFWGVMSVLLEATRGSGLSDPTKKAVLISLCGRMLDRLLGNNGVQCAGWGEQELRLYLRVLALQGKHDEALKLLKTPYCQATLMPGEAYQASISLLLITKNWRQLNTSMKELLWENPDRWDYYKHYFDSAFQLFNSEKGSQDSEEKVDDTPLKCKEYLDKIVERVGKPELRGPHLAKLELFKRLGEQNMDPEGVLGKVHDLMVGYMNLFGHKACSVSDLRMYLHLVPRQERPSLVEAFRQATLIKDTEDFFEINESYMQHHISILQLSRICGVPPRVEQLLRALQPPRPIAVAVAQRLPTDPYCLLLAYHLLDSALEQKTTQLMLRALDVLHDTVSRSPSNHHCKLLAMKIYHMLGCGWGAQQMYSSLEVKHVQLDSLGHLHVALLGSTGLLALAKEHFEHAHKFFVQSYKESSDHLMLSYKFGSFNKLEELMDWRERLNASLHHALCVIEKHMFDIHSVVTHTNGAMPQYTPPDWETLRDNRDVGIQVELNELKEDIDVAANTQRDFKRELLYCKLKGGILMCVCTSGETLKEHVDHLEAVAKEAKEYIQPMSRLGALLLLVPIYIDVFQNTSKVEKTEGKIEGLMSLVDECCIKLSAEQSAVLEALEVQANHDDSLWTYRATMEKLVNYVELVSVACVACGRCITENLTNNINPSSKSKGSSNHTTNRISPLLGLLQSLQAGIGKWPAPAPSLVHGIQGLSLKQAEFPQYPPWELVSEHHSKALMSIQQIIKDKIKYLTSLPNA